MQVIKARNAHQALPKVMYLLATQGHIRESRNGRVVKVPGPVSIEYQKPQERVVFWPERDANPFFHLLEAVWMLAGRNDVEFVAGIVKKIETFSDDGKTLNAAYGFRWRHHFGYDQLKSIASALKADQHDRRQVLSMWDPTSDLGNTFSKDLPCNTQVFFSRTDTGALDMMITNRSNDIVWGALGANAVHFSMLQEYMANQIGCEVGKYWQITNNLHLYLKQHEVLMHQMAEKAWPSSCPYGSGSVKNTPLFPLGDTDNFDSNIAMLLDEGAVLGMTDWFTRKVAIPMLTAIETYKEMEASKAQKVLTAQKILTDIMPAWSDWRRAGLEWLERRRK